MDKTLLELVRDLIPDFALRENVSYTLRYIFYASDPDKKNACFSVVTGLWNIHEETYKRLLADDSIGSCLVEYVCEYDSCLCGAVVVLKDEKKVEVIDNA